MKDVLELETTDHLMTALEESGIDTSPPLLAMKDSDIDNLSITQGGMSKAIPLAKKILIRV